jgi:hypothetical protein
MRGFPLSVPPPAYGHQSFEFGGGDPDPDDPPGRTLLAATNRPLWRYTQSKNLFEGPSDRGFDTSSFLPLPPCKSLFLGFWDGPSSAD